MYLDDRLVYQMTDSRVRKRGVANKPPAKVCSALWAIGTFAVERKAALCVLGQVGFYVFLRVTLNHVIPCVHRSSFLGQWDDGSGCSRRDALYVLEGMGFRSVRLHEEASLQGTQHAGRQTSM